MIEYDLNVVVKLFTLTIHNVDLLFKIVTIHIKIIT